MRGGMQRAPDVLIGVDCFARGTYYRPGVEGLAKPISQARQYGLSLGTFAPGWTYETFHAPLLTTRHGTPPTSSSGRASRKRGHLLHRAGGWAGLLLLHNTHRLAIGSSAMADCHGRFPEPTAVCVLF